MGTSKAYSGNDDEGGELTIETWACSRGLGRIFSKEKLDDPSCTNKSRHPLKECKLDYAPPPLYPPYHIMHQSCQNSHLTQKTHPPQTPCTELKVKINLNEHNKHKKDMS